MSLFQMKTAIWISAFTFLVSLNSCISWTDAQGNKVKLIEIEVSGANHDYDELDAEEKEMIVFLDSTEEKIPPSIPNKVYAVNGAQMKSSMESGKRYVLYMWKPECKSKNCVPISAVKRYADAKGAALRVVLDDSYDANYVRFLTENPNQNFLINFNYYHTESVVEFSNLFLKDLGQPLPGKKELSPNVLLFEGQELKHSRSGLPADGEGR